MAGRPPDVTNEEILQVILESKDPVLFTGEVAEELPIGRDGTLKRLNELKNSGKVKRKKRGNTVIWWMRSDEGE